MPPFKTLCVAYKAFAAGLLCLLLACSSGPKPGPSSNPSTNLAPASLPMLPLPALHLSWLNPTPQGNPLNDIWGVAQTVIAVGDAGTVLRSTDAGQSWHLIPSGTHEDLLSLWGDQATHTDSASSTSSQGAVYIAGRHGVILRSQDNGATWSQLTTPTKSSLFGICGLHTSSSNGSLYAVGDAGTLLTSTDQGQSWSLLNSGTQQRLYGIWCVSHAGSASLPGSTSQASSTKSEPTSSPSMVELYAVGAAGTLLRSKDGGKSWLDSTASEALANHGMRYDLYRVFGTSPDDVFVVGRQGTILHSIDQGETWLLEQSNTPSHLQAIWGSGAAYYAVGQFGNITRSTDGGATWTTQQLGDFRDHPRHLRGAFGLRPDALFAVGDEGLLLRSSDGVAWSGSTSPLRQGLHSIVARGGQLLAVGDHGAIYSSFDKGLTWSAQASNFDGALQDIFALASGPIFAVGLQGVLLYSEDGQTWAQATAFTSEHLYSLWAADISRLFMVGDKGQIFISSDMGLTWEPQQSPTQAKLLSIWGRSNSEVYAVGQDGVIVRSADQGATWTLTQLEGPSPASNPKDAQPPATQKEGQPPASLEDHPEKSATSKPNAKTPPVKGSPHRLWDVTGRGTAEVYAVGNGGLIARSIDQGKTWSVSHTSGGEDLHAVFSDDAALYAVGAHGAFYGSSDGVHWEQLPSNTSQDLSDIISLDGSLFLVGEAGAILTATK